MKKGYIVGGIIGLGTLVAVIAIAANRSSAQPNPNPNPQPYQPKFVKGDVLILYGVAYQGLQYTVMDVTGSNYSLAKGLYPAIGSPATYSAQTIDSIAVYSTHVNIP